MANRKFLVIDHVGRFFPEFLRNVTRNANLQLRMRNTVNFARREETIFEIRPPDLYKRHFYLSVLITYFWRCINFACWILLDLDFNTLDSTSL